MMFEGCTCESNNHSIFFYLAIDIYENVLHLVHEKYIYTSKFKSQGANTLGVIN
jgi:hypothetical protein